ncbi:MAG: DUF2007 domain-containing protein [Algicola sp.]|nr:DUF2007 domain-containing protein [Algicola sp.]
MMDSNSELVSIYPAENGIEGNLVKGLLTGEGIDVQLRGGEHLGGAIGELPADALVSRVYVSKFDEQQGRAIVDNYVKNRKSVTDAATDWVCGHCGETNTAQFEICWQCQKDPNES